MEPGLGGLWARSARYASRSAAVGQAFGDDLAPTRDACDAAQAALRDFRILAVLQTRGALGPEERRLVENSYRRCVAGGALLEPSAKARFAEIDIRLGELSVRFGHNVMAANADWSLVLANDDLAGLPDAVQLARPVELSRPERTVIASRSIAATSRTSSLFRPPRPARAGLAGLYRPLRRWPHDNWPIIDEIVALRHERARLLCFATYAGPNLSVAGSLATILWLQAIRREGEDVTFLAFLKVGVLAMPPALVAALASRLLLG